MPSQLTLPTTRVPSARPGLEPAVTIDLQRPHRSLTYRIVRSLHRSRRLDLDALNHVGQLDSTTRQNAEFLLECIEESAKLNGFGRMMLENFVKEVLLNRSQIARRFEGRSFPPVTDPVIILGLPRTGSTYLFNLLGATRRFRTLRNWETHKVASRRPVFLKKAEAALLLKALHHFAPGLLTIHEQRLEGPEECTKPLLSCFVSQMFAGLFHIPRYNEFLETADFLPTYELYHRQLQIMGDHGKRWLLKSPIHIQSLESVLRVFPDARFIHLHRDFTEVLGSTCSLSAAFRCLTSDRPNGPQIGSEVKKFLVRDLAKAQAVLEANPEKVLDIHYKSFVSQPARTIRKILDFAGCDFSEADEHAIRREMQVSTPNKFGVHRYRISDYFPPSVAPHPAGPELEDPAIGYPDPDPASPSPPRFAP